MQEDWYLGSCKLRIPSLDDKLKSLSDINGCAALRYSGVKPRGKSKSTKKRLFP
jgi:hypothetical protein